MAQSNTNELKYIDNISEICNREPKFVHHQYSASIFVDSKEIQCLSVIEVSVTRDFLSHYGDQVNLGVIMKAADYSNYIFPNRENLKITLSKKQIAENSQIELSSPITSTSSYVAKLATATDINGKGIADNDGDVSTGAVATTMYILYFQLIPENLYYSSKQTIGIKYDEGTPADALKTLLGTAGDNVNVAGGDNSKILGVEMVEADNKNVYRDMIIDHNTPVPKLAQVVQTEHHGIYNTAIGCYLFNQHWYVYPLYDISRYKKEERRFNIILTTSQSAALGKRSYYVQGNEVFIMAVPANKVNDSSVSNKENDGNAIRVTDPDLSINDESIKSDDNTITIDPSKSTTEMKVDKDENSPVKIPDYMDKVTTNMSNALSTIASNLGMQMQLIWYNANPDLIFPAAPVKIIFFKDDQPVEMYGSILVTDTYTVGNGMIPATRHATNCGIGVFVSADNTELKAPNQSGGGSAAMFAGGTSSSSSSTGLKYKNKVSDKTI